MKAKVYVTLKKSVLDPQGTTVQRSLKQIGYENITSVRIGKFIELEVNAGDKEAATKQVDEVCSKLLYNPNIEEYRFELVE